MPYTARTAKAELLHLLTSTRRDWRQGDVMQLMTHLEHLGWTWPQILARLPAVAAEEGSRPGDVLTGGWTNPNGRRGQPPTEDYEAARAALPHPHREGA